MGIAEQMQDVLKEREHAMSSEPGFLELRKFYEEMLKLGIAKKQDYTLPQLDTIGRRLNESTPTRFLNDFPIP